MTTCALSSNRGERRDLSEGERAMALAFLYPEPPFTKRRQGQESIKPEKNFRL
jgi:hypothetical protein